MTISKKYTIDEVEIVNDLPTAHQFINMTGKKINRLTVLGYAGKNDKRRHYWWCQCDCGNIVKIDGTKLRNGHTKSCGCLITEKATKMGKESKKEIIPGTKFNKLTVLKEAGKRKSNNEYLYQCLCDCGNITIVSGGNLRSGEVKSCGCLGGKSYGEEVIDSLLTNAQINFTREQTFSTCHFPDSKKSLRFDFYVNDKYLIEFDGSQHFKSKESGWNTKENLERTQKSDAFKNNWCKENNIPLIRIPYWHLKDLCIEDLLLETSKFIVNYEEEKDETA